MYELNERQIKKIIAMVEDFVADAVNDALANATGYETRKKKSRDERLADKIIAALQRAPSMAEQHADIQMFLRMQSMPKTLLRRQVGNSYKNFAAVLDMMVSDGRLIYRRIAWNNKRYLHVYGLPNESVDAHFRA